MKLIEKILFIILSSQIIYLLIHLQFLFQMPQAALAIQDSIFIFISALTIFILSKGNKKIYFLGLFILLFPTFELQYFYIKIFNKPFLISEMRNFLTLLQVSSIPKKLGYSFLFLLWFFNLCYFLIYAIKNWITASTFQKSISIIGILICYQMLTYNKEVDIWHQDPRANFFGHGVLSAIQVEPKIININIDPEEVLESLKNLKKLEEQRIQYPASLSPSVVPKNKRPIIMIIVESFYDFKHFYSLFAKNPFPKSYLDTIQPFNYTGPNQTFGSFQARFVSLTGAYHSIHPKRNEVFYPTLPRILSEYGYTTIALESMQNTYSLSTYYKLWKFDKQYFQLYGSDWTGRRTDPNTYEKNITRILQNTPDNIIPFYFGFTYLGHGGSCAFTDNLPDPENIDHFLSYFADEKKHNAKQLLKANIFNAERLISIKNMILNKFPDALIIFKSDHYSTELSQRLQESNLPKDMVDSFFEDPVPLPFMVFDGTNGILELPYGFSPANIPLMILAEAGLPYKNTLISMLYREMPNNIMNIYDRLFMKKGNKFEIFATNTTSLKDYEILSIDLYQGKSYSLDMIANNVENFVSIN
ncbi:hypothetical protein SAMN02745150_00074 [Brevinema andersonii]|uniref:Phosphoglycerol transferase MdoB n=1 Tax=Brevinema andersonii TaxID=34097 RepID=A0A1I1CY00_BREAD|nr:hypothetical protein [Brevinema andersonii]SFB67531.1 hypothetical protein SAMN02745150_00074 [Brevinema andersonii]